MPKSKVRASKLVVCTDIKSTWQFETNPVFSCLTDHIGACKAGEHHGHADHGYPQHLFIRLLFCFLFHSSLV